MNGTSLSSGGHRCRVQKCTARQAECKRLLAELLHAPVLHSASFKALQTNLQTRASPLALPLPRYSDASTPFDAARVFILPGLPAHTGSVQTTGQI